MAQIDTYIKCEDIKNSSLKMGDKIFLTGYIYTARDAAHKKIFELLDEGKEPPFEIVMRLYVMPGRPGRRRILLSVVRADNIGKNGQICPTPA